jgi:hypothetical protein
MMPVSSSVSSPARISATLTLPQDRAVSIDEMAFEIPRGACLDVFFSNRFRAVDLAAMPERCGFGRSHRTETAISAEAVWHAERI